MPVHWGVSSQAPAGAASCLLYCPKTAQARVREALSALQSLEFRFDWGGARIAFAQ